jgi:heme exporter protein B
MLRQLYAFLSKDLLQEFRSKEILTLLFIFTLLVLIIFAFSLGPLFERMEVLTPAILWITFTFAGILGLNRSFLSEREEGALRGIALSPVDPGIVFLGKTLSNFFFITLVEIIALPLFVVLFQFPFHQPLLILFLFLGTLGFSIVGTLLAGVASSSRRQEILLPILLFPILIPLFIAVIKGSHQLLLNESFDKIKNWINLLIVYDGIFLVISYLSFGIVLEE